MPDPLLSRRRFLYWSGAGAIAMAGGRFGVEDLLARAQVDPLTPGTGVLVVLTLYGGNDGLNTLIPAADPAYQDARPQLAYQPGEVLDLGDGLGLNPVMVGMKKLWDDRRLSVVRGVEYPNPDHSHFRSMDIWQSASPEEPTNTGWLGRWLDATGRDPLRAVALGPVLPPMLAGATTAGAAIPIDAIHLPSGVEGAAFAALGAPDQTDRPAQADAARTIVDLHRAALAFGPALAGADHANRTPTNPETSAPTPDPGTTGPKTKAGGQELARELSVVAECIETGAPARVYSVSLGGFDTHTGERATQQRLLGELDTALSTFINRMSTTARGRNVVLVAYSEFGRRVTANANQGTDHGTAGPVFVTGPKVRGGYVGDQPSLTDLKDGDLKVTTDFRDIYATLLSEVLGSDPAQILGPGRRTLPLIRT